MPWSQRFGGRNRVDRRGERGGVEQVGRADRQVLAYVVERGADLINSPPGQCGPGQTVRSQLHGDRSLLAARSRRPPGLPVDDIEPATGSVGEDRINPAAD